MNKRNIDENVKPTLFSRLNTSDKMYTAKDISKLINIVCDNYESEISTLVSEIANLKANCFKNPTVVQPTLSILDIVYLEDEMPYLKIQFNPGSYEYDIEGTGVELSSIKINDNENNLISTLSCNELLPISTNISSFSFDYTSGKIPHNNMGTETPEYQISAKSETINIDTIWINALTECYNNESTCITNFDEIDENISKKLKLHILKSKIMIYTPEKIDVKQVCILVPDFLNISSVEIFDFKDGYAYQVNSKQLSNSKLYYLDQAVPTTHINSYKIIFNKL